MFTSLKLPFHFDSSRLKADLEKIGPDEWIPHFNKGDYEGQWSGVSLRAAGGREQNLMPELMSSAGFEDTPLLERCSYVREVMATLQCPLKTVRFLKLHAGSSIREHVDRDLAFEEGEVRLHIPVITNQEIAFYLNGERIMMAEGECWYTNVNLPHRVDNTSAIDRVHLVIDCAVNDWLRSIFEATRQAGQQSSAYAILALLPDTASLPELLNAFSKFADLSKTSAQPASFIVKSNHSTLSWKARVQGMAQEWGVTIYAEQRLQSDTEMDRIVQLYRNKRQAVELNYAWRLCFESMPDP